MRPQQYVSVAIIITLLLFRASAATLYVSLNSTNPVPPYAGWNTAATNIQNAVNAASNGDVIFVTNGVYQTGGLFIPGGLGDDTATNRLAITKPVTVKSVNSPAVTVINGGSAFRCAYLTNGAVLTGFTLTNGVAGFGGGVYCTSDYSTVSNCLILNNTAPYNEQSGGGAYGGLLVNCSIVSNNAANGLGGGASHSTVVNCKLIGNIGGDGGGVSFCSVQNSMLMYNTAQDGGGSWRSALVNCLLVSNLVPVFGGGDADSYLTNCTLAYNRAGGGAGGGDASQFVNCINYDNIVDSSSNTNGGAFFLNCCTTPLPPASAGSGNITNDPAFVNPAGGDFHLQSNSPCINSGNNSFVAENTDLDGNPRIVGGTVDIGAYEYQTPVSKISYAWLEQYGLPINTNTDTADPDHDGMNNYQEWIAGTNPTNALSVLEMLSPLSRNNPTGLLVSWDSVSNRTYYLQSSTNLAVHPAFSTIRTNIEGLVGTTSYTDTNAVGPGPFFYRVGVQ